MNKNVVRPPWSRWTNGLPRGTLSPLLWATAAVSLVAGCTGSPRKEARPARVVQRNANAAPTAVQPNTSAPFDVGRVMRQVHFAFRPAAGGRFEGGHATHTLAVDRAGALYMTPVHHRRAHPPLAARRACRLVTTSVKRGESDLAGSDAQISIDSSGALGVQRGDVVERLRNSAAGVEQSWSFARRPGGSGDLVVRVEVSGLQHSGSTGRGLHFVDATTGLGVRYGWATWVDAHGARTELRGVIVDGAIELRVPGEAVDRAAYPAVLDPTINAEFGMDKPVHGPPEDKQEQPAVAYGGGVYLVVWQDLRGAKSDIVGTMVSSAGVVQLPLGVAVTTAKGEQLYPAAAFDGTNFMVVWQDGRSGWDIYAARVSPAGSLVGQEAALSTASGNQQRPAVVFGKTYYLVAWQDSRNTGWDIYGTRVDKNGATQDSAGIAIAQASGDQTNPALGFDGTNFMAVWQDKGSVTDWNIYCARITAGGSLLDSSGKAVSLASNNQLLPALAFDGTNYLIVWEDDRNGTTGTKWDIFGTRVSSSASVLDPAGIPISKYTTDQDDQREPAVAFDGTNFLVAWQDNRLSTTNPAQWDIFGARVSTAGAVVNTSGSSAFTLSDQTGDQEHVALIHGGSHFLAVWTDGRFDGLGLGSSSGANIYGARVSPAGAVQEAAGIPVSIDINPQQEPGVAHDGTNYLVVWSDYRTKTGDASWDVIGARVNASGTLLDPAGITISAAFNDQKDPAVAFGATGYLVSWSDYRAVTAAGLATGWDIYAARITKAGAVTDATGIAVSKAVKDQRFPAVAFDGAQFLLAWQDQRTSVNTDIYAARVSAAGVVVDTAGFAVSSAASLQERPAVASDGTQFLVVWQDRRSDPQWDIFGARVSASGALLDSTGIAISQTSNSQQLPAVTSDGTRFMAAWQDKRSGADYDVYAARVSAAGAVQDVSGIAAAKLTADQTTPAICYDGHNFVVAWETKGASSQDIQGVRLTAAGAVADKVAFVLMGGDAVDQLGVALSSDGDGQVLAAYYRPDPATIYGVDRVRAVLAVTSAKQGKACQVDADCQSGHCSDKVCCDTACGGGVSTDCQACSKAAGAAADGTCGPAAASTVCRPALGSCDQAESCDGTATSCPADLFVADGSPCTNGSCAKGICVPKPDGGGGDAGTDADVGVSDAALDALEAGADLAPDGPGEGGVSDATPDGDGPQATEAGKDLGEAGAGDATLDSAGTETGAGLEAGAKVDAAKSTYCLGPSCKEADGCTCRVNAGPGASNPSGAALLIAPLLLLLWRGRRRAKREEVRR